MKIGSEGIRELVRKLLNVAVLVQLVSQDVPK